MCHVVIFFPNHLQFHIFKKQLFFSEKNILKKSNSRNWKRWRKKNIYFTQWDAGSRIERSDDSFNLFFFSPWDHSFYLTKPSQSLLNSGLGPNLSHRQSTTQPRWQSATTGNNQSNISTRIEDFSNFPYSLSAKMPLETFNSTFPY